MTPVTKLAMVILMETDLEKAVDFYQQLGLTLIFHIKERWAEFELNGIKIGLCPSSKEVTEYRTGIVFEVRDLHAFYEATKDQFSYLDKPSEAVHGIMISVKDPGGNIVDLYQSTPEKVRTLVDKAIQEKEKLEQPATGCCKSERVTCCND